MNYRTRSCQGSLQRSHESPGKTEYLQHGDNIFGMYGCVGMRRVTVAGFTKSFKKCGEVWYKSDTANRLIKGLSHVVMAQIGFRQIV